MLPWGRWRYLRGCSPGESRLLNFLLVRALRIKLWNSSNPTGWLGRETRSSSSRWRRQVCSRYSRSFIGLCASSQSRISRIVCRGGYRDGNECLRQTRTDDLLKPCLGMIRKQGWSCRHGGSASQDIGCRCSNAGAGRGRFGGRPWSLRSGCQRWSRRRKRKRSLVRSATQSPSATGEINSGTRGLPPPLFCEIVNCSPLMCSIVRFCIQPCRRRSSGKFPSTFSRTDYAQVVRRSRYCILRLFHRLG